jgi:hypothetical protein
MKRMLRSLPDIGKTRPISAAVKLIPKGRHVVLAFSE